MVSQYTLLVVLAFVSLVGGINWLFTAINNWSKDEVTFDLLTEQLKIHPNIANVIYIFVFLCTLALFTMIAFPHLF